MCRRATPTPIDAATPRCDSDGELIGIPLEAEPTRRRHVAGDRGRRDHRRTGEVAFPADTHSILPVAIERRDGALPFLERVRSLTETRSTPRLADLTADRSKHLGDRFAVEPRVGPLDLTRDAAR